MATEPHLGGYIEGGDENTWNPTLWRYLIEELGVRSMLDVGCGEGRTVQFFHDLGVRAFGIDGVPQEQAGVICHDFTEDRYWPLMCDEIPTRFDLVWSAEFVEHVEERFIPNYLPCFAAAPLVLMTHAVPGQHGHHHVSCFSRDYWRGVFAAIGFLIDDELTERTRLLAAQDESPLNYYSRTGLALRRT